MRLKNCLRFLLLQSDGRALLKQFNLDPEHPPSEFTGVYRYALVEYGVGKPRVILQLFRLEVVQKAFHQAFDVDNPNIVIAQIEEVLEPGLCKLFFIGTAFFTTDFEYIE